MKTNLFTTVKHPRYWTAEERGGRFLAATAQALRLAKRSASAVPGGRWLPANWLLHSSQEGV
jgi:hypothetical protein